MSKKISDLTAASTVASTDLVPIVDVSDTSQAATGTTKKATVQDILALASSGGAPADASYVTLGTNGTLTSERVLTAGTGISVADGGAGSTATVTNTSPMVQSSYVTIASDANLTSERVLTAGSGISITDGGAGSTVTIDNSAPMVQASYITLATSAGLTSERVLTAGTNITLTDNGAGGTLVISASGGGGGTPGGSNQQFQWNSAGAFAGSSGLVYDATNNQPQAPNGYAIPSGAFKLSLVAATISTSNKTITFPNATGTVVLTDTVDNLSNKTIVAANNTITDTSAAAGDLLKHNGTRFARFARGTALYYLRTNSGGTDLEWAAFPTLLSVAGSANEIQTNSGSSTLAAATNVKAGSGYISIGATVPSSGSIRLATASTIIWRNNGNTADLSWITTNSTDDLVIGQLTGSQYGNVYINSVTTQNVTFQDNSFYRFVIYSQRAAFFSQGSWGTTGGGSTPTNVIFLANSSLSPTNMSGTAPTGGGLLFAEGGALKWKGSSGLVTTIATA